MSQPNQPDGFGRWETFQACTLDMTQQGHDAESASQICTDIQHRAEKGLLYKSADSFEILKGKDGAMYVYGPASWEVPDMEYPVPDVATVEFQQNFLKKLFAMPDEYQNVSIDHQSLIIGKPVKKMVGDDGQTYYSHVHEKGMMLITKIRGDINLGWVKKYRDDIENGVYKMYSIRASNATRQLSMLDGKKVNKLLNGDPIEVAIVKQGCCPKAGPLKIISKSAETIDKTLPLEAQMTQLYNQTADNLETVLNTKIESSPPLEIKPEKTPVPSVAERINQLFSNFEIKSSQQQSVQTVDAKPDLTREQIFQKYFPEKKRSE
jgi:hypothetical protein